MAFALPLAKYKSCQEFNQNENISLDYADIMADNKIDAEIEKKEKLA
jgi:hypothetical protein